MTKIQYDFRNDGFYSHDKLLHILYKLSGVKDYFKNRRRGLN